MLPLPTRLVSKPVDGPGRDVERERFLSKSGRVMPEPHSARTDEGYPCYELEVWHVAAPPELRPGRILRNQCVRRLTTEALQIVQLSKNRWRDAP